MLAVLTAVSFSAHAVDFWQYPEMADRNAVFAGIFPLQFTFAGYFSVRSAEFFADWLLPVGLPFSLGFSINPVDPDVYSIGGRIGYHVNFDDERLDVYILYQADYVTTSDGYARVDLGGRFGIRRRFGGFLCFAFETGFMFQYFNIGIAIKCN
jgi:outer membrane receptor protein involved in Fe transport